MKTIRFPLVKDRKWKTRLPSRVGLHGSEFCAASMLHNAIIYRVEAMGHARRAATAAEFHDHRREAIERIAERHARVGMRESALWARVFAQHFPAEDSRLERISAEKRGIILRAFRAGIWFERYQKVAAKRNDATVTQAELHRIDGILTRIAAKHDELTPYGFTLTRA